MNRIGHFCSRWTDEQGLKLPWGVYERVRMHARVRKIVYELTYKTCIVTNWPLGKKSEPGNCFPNGKKSEFIGDYFPQGKKPETGNYPPNPLPYGGRNPKPLRFLALAGKKTQSIYMPPDSSLWPELSWIRPMGRRKISQHQPMTGKDAGIELGDYWKLLG